MSDSCDPTDCSLPGSSVHWILQARVLEWVAIPYSSPSDLPDPGTEPGSPALQADSLPSEPPRKYYLDRMVIKRCPMSIYMPSWSFSSAGSNVSPERTVKADSLVTISPEKQVSQISLRGIW